MTKIVINACYGGFGLSDAGVMTYARHKGIKLYRWIDPKCSSSMFGTSYYTVEPVYGEMPVDKYYFSSYDIERDDPALVATVEELGKAAGDSCSNLVVQELSRGTLYRIIEYDGFESFETQDDINWKVA